MINICIDPPDFKAAAKNHIHKSNNQLIDEIESFYELVSEEMLGVEVPESEENDIDSSSPSLDLYCFAGRVNNTLPMVFSLKHFSHYRYNYSLGYTEPKAPPPKC